MDTRTEEPRTAPPIETTRKPRRRTSLIGSIFALLALAGLAWLAWHLTHRQPDPAAARGGRGGPAATTVGVAAADRADIPIIVEALGTVSAPTTITVRPQVGGVLQKVVFKEGQMVKAGELLATIDPRQFEMALMQATGQRQRDEAQLDNARLLLKRNQTLLAQDSIARQEVDTQAALVKQLEGTVVADRAAEGAARLNFGYTRITAPISGLVGLRTVDAGNVVGANDANGIAVITQVSPIDVQFSVPQDLVPQLRARIVEGASLPATALDRTRATVLETGRFLALDNQVDPQTGTVKAKARFDNAKLALFPSQFVNVRLLLNTIEGAVVVPVTALRHASKGDYVFVVNAADRTVAQRAVKRGQATADKVEIVSGLSAGEQVITEGADRLNDGDKVTLPGDNPAGGQRQGQRQQGARTRRPAQGAAK
jgi:multidrug efflux system membrane fusion protein